MTLLVTVVLSKDLALFAAAIATAIAIVLGIVRIAEWCDQ